MLKPAISRSTARQSEGAALAANPVAATIAAIRPARARTVAEPAPGDRPTVAPRWRKKAVDLASTVATSFFLFAINAVQAVLLARALAPEGRGEYAAALSYTRLLTYIGLLGTNFVIVRWAARAASSTVAISRAAVRMGCLTGLGTMLVVMVLSLMALPADKQYLAWLSITCALSLPLEHIRLNLNAVDQGSGRMARFNAGRIVAAVALPVLLGIAWLTCGITVRLAALLLIPSTAIGLVFRLLWSDDHRLWRPGSPSTGVLLREAHPYAFSVIVSDLFSRLDTILILWLAGFSQQGLYAAAVPAVQLLVVAPEALAVFAFNAGAKQSRPPGAGRLLTLAVGTFLAQALAALAYWMILGYLITLVYGKAFGGAVAFATALLPALVFQGCTIVADGYMRGRGQANVGIWARLAGAVAMSAAAFALYAPYRELAAPLAASVGSGVAALWLMATMVRQALWQQRSSAPQADGI
ncbi:MAG: lipopolysaccharide biosynthesis protein [Thermoguttaceae bacterium]